MKFAVQFEDSFLGTITLAETEYFIFHASIFKFYSSAKIIIKEISGTRVNKIKIGTPVKVIFYDDNSDTKYTNNMRVLSFTKEETSGISIRMTLVLVSSLFFYNTPITNAYEGSVSQIADYVIKNNLQTEVTNYAIEATDDRGRIRYSISEQPQEFLKRIMKYGVVSNGPVYMYYDTKGCFNLKGISSFKQKDPEFIDVTAMVDKMGIQIELAISTRKLCIYNYKFNVNKSKQVSDITSKFCTELFKSPNTVALELVSNGEQTDNASVAQSYPSRVDFYDWNIAPDDAVGMALKTSFEDLGTFQSLTAIYSGMLVNELDLGSLHYVILPDTPTEKSSMNADVNSSEGTYMATDVSFIFKDSQSHTEATLLQVGH